MSSYHSYPSLYALGHRAVQDLLKDPVIVEEKIDGSQFSFGLFVTPEGPVLRCRSKGAEINMFAPDKMFSKAVETVKSLEDTLRPGWTYRAEYLAKPKHNALAYDRVPHKHLIIFDINTEHEEYLSPTERLLEATRIGLEAVPLLGAGMFTDVTQFRGLLERVSVLGGQKIEGVVVKNYARFGVDKKVLMGKFVSEAFKEVHAAEWKTQNPTRSDVVETLITELRSPARWNKAVQHLREAGALEDSPADIGKLMKEVPDDILKEEAEYIKQRLFDHAWPQIRRGATKGLPEHYKNLLLERQFNQGDTHETSIQDRAGHSSGVSDV